MARTREMPEDYVPYGMPPKFWEGLSAEQRRQYWDEEQRERDEADARYQEEEARCLVGIGLTPWAEVDCSLEGIAESCEESWVDCQDRWDAIAVNELSRRPGVFERPYVKRDHADSSRVPTVHQFYDDLYCLGELGEVDEDPDSGLLASPGMTRRDGILVNHVDRERGKRLHLYQDYAGFLQGIVKEQSYIYLGRFANVHKEDGRKFLGARSNQMLELGGFCVDVDRTETHEHGYYEPAAVVEEVMGTLDDNPELMPTYVMLSGTGIQLWYVFGQRIPLLNPRTSPRRFKYEDLLRRLYRRFDDLLARAVVHVDMPCATLCHGFRAPGSPAKGGYTTRLFARDGRGRRTWDPLDLSELLGGSLEEYDVGPWDQNLYEQVRSMTSARGRRGEPATSRQRAYLAKLAKLGCCEALPESAEITIAQADTAIKAAEEVYARAPGEHAKRLGGPSVRTARGHEVVMRPRSPKLYEYTLRRIQAGESKPGTRYNALVALAGVAWNCGVLKSRVKEDMMAMLDLPWARKSGIKSPRPLERADVDNALRAYNALGALRPREQIESNLGWTYGFPAKRNGRGQHEHLWGEWKNDRGDKVVNVARVNRGYALEAGRKRRAEEKTNDLAEWISENPGGSKRRACDDLHMSRSTVTKYWPEACAMAGVDDTRTGTCGRGVGDRR